MGAADQEIVGPLTDLSQPLQTALRCRRGLELDGRQEEPGLKATFVFEKTAAEEAEAEAIQDENVICKCPVCDKGNIYATPLPTSAASASLGNGCKGRLSTRDVQIRDPASRRRSSSKKARPISSKTGFPRKAALSKRSLTCNPKGRRILNWQFPPREAKKAATKKKAPAKKAAAKKKGAKK